MAYTFDISDNRRIVEALKTGDEETFKEVYTAFCAPLRHYATTILQNEQAAYEVVQDVFTAVWLNRKRLDAAKPLRNYLLREGVRLGQHPGLTNHQNHGGNDRSRTSGQGRARHPASPHTAANASFHVVEIPAVRTGTIVRRLQPGPDAVQQLFIVLIEIPMRKIGSFHNTG